MSEMSFADMMGTFGKSIVIEAKASSIIANSLMPTEEVRKFLRAKDDIKGNHVFKYLQEVTPKVGIGDLDLISVEKFDYRFRIHNCKVHNIYPWTEKGMVCSVTVNFLGRFFSKNLGLPANIEETACVANDDGHCEFLVSLQPLAAFSQFLDAEDKEILTQVSNGEHIDESHSEHLAVLKEYGLIGEDGKLTDVGDACLKCLTSTPKKEEKVTPPWEKKKVSMDVAVGDLFDKAFDAAFGGR